MNPKWVMNENITNAVKSQSIPAANPPTTAAGSWGLGWIGGGATNSFLILRLLFNFDTFSRTPLPEFLLLGRPFKLVPLLKHTAMI